MNISQEYNSMILHFFFCTWQNFPSSRQPWSLYILNKPHKHWRFERERDFPDGQRQEHRAKKCC